MCKHCIWPENPVAIEEDPILTAQQRLAASRRALMRQLGHHDGSPAKASSLDAGPAAVLSYRSSGIPLDSDNEPDVRPRFSDRFVWTAVARNVAQRWWRRHPANAASQLARPLLERYAREQPVKLLAGAAALGAVTVIVKPWRLLSLTAMLAAILKTSDVADLVTTLMHNNSSPRKDAP